MGPLHGLPVATLDNADVAGERTAAGLDPSLVEPAAQDSVVVERLRDAGAVPIGKTHIPELGFGTTDSTWGEPTSTPFDTDRNSGGSSGGSTAAVAAGCVPLAVGIDGDGSLRIPSSWCDTVGLKPTFRRVPRVNRRPDDAFGNLMPFSEFGPIARTPADAGVDLLVAPTLAVPPVENATDGYTVGPDEVDGTAVDPHLGWCLTHPCNFTGHPAANVLAGRTGDGLPVGPQVIAPRFGEDLILAACGALERVNPWEYPSF